MNEEIKIQCDVSDKDSLSFRFSDDGYFVVEMTYCGGYVGTTIVSHKEAVKLRDFINEKLS